MTDPSTPTAATPADAYTPSPIRPGTARAIPDQAGTLMDAVSGPGLRHRDGALAFPVHLRDRLTAVLEEGRRAAQEGTVADVDDDDPVSEQVQAQRAAIRAKALHDCVPPHREDTLAGLGSLDADQQPKALAVWLADPRARTLILAGNTGSGKTQAAYALAAEAAQRGAAMVGRGGKVTTRPLLVRAWTVNGYLASLRPDGSALPVWLIRDRARDAELLLLDDLGAATDAETTEFTRKELGELLDYRLEQRLRTVFTTNFGSGALQKRYGDPLMSRLVLDATAIRITGPDRRNLRNLTW